MAAVVMDDILICGYCLAFVLKVPAGTGMLFLNKCLSSHFLLSYLYFEVVVQ